MSHTPWYYALSSAGNGFTIREGDPNDWLVIGKVGMTNDPKVAEARAERITRAVNSHDDLLEACKALRKEYFETIGYCGSRVACGHPDCAIVEAADKAIAKAEASR